MLKCLAVLFFPRKRYALYHSFACINNSAIAVNVKIITLSEQQLVWACPLFVCFRLHALFVLVRFGGVSLWIEPCVNSKKRFVRTLTQ